MLCRPLQLVVVVMAVAGVWTAPTQSLLPQHREAEPTFMNSITQFLQSLLNKNQQVATQINQQIQKVQNNPAPGAPAVPPKTNKRQTTTKDATGTPDKPDEKPFGVRDSPTNENLQATEGASANSKDYRANPIMKAAMNLYIATWNYQAETQGLPMLKIDNVWPHSGLVHMPEVNKFIANIQNDELVAKTAEDMKHIYSTIQEPASSQPEYTAEVFLETWRQAAVHFKAFEPSAIHDPTVNRLKKDSAKNQDEEGGESARKAFTAEGGEVQSEGCKEFSVDSATSGVALKNTDEENAQDQIVPHQVKAETDDTSSNGNEDVQTADVAQIDVKNTAGNENENDQGTHTDKIAGQEEKNSAGGTDSQPIGFPEKIDTLTPQDQPSDANNQNNDEESPVVKDSTDSEDNEPTEFFFGQDSASPYYPRLRPIAVKDPPGHVNFKNLGDNQSLEQSDDFRVIEVPFGVLTSRNV